MTNHAHLASMHPDGSVAHDYHLGKSKSRPTITPARKAVMNRLAKDAKPYFVKPPKRSFMRGH